jgi:ribonuclease HI
MIILPFLIKGKKGSFLWERKFLTQSGYIGFMNDLMILTDGSVNTRSKIGYGAYLAISERGLPLDSLRSRVKVRRFEHTSSTKLELQTLLWALSDIQTSEEKLIIYTDSQNIMGLQRRRNRFEQNDYRSKENRRLNNYELYQEFFRITDQLDCEFISVRGHKRSNQKDDIDILFTLVDRASRNALRGDYPCLFNS